MIEVEDIDVLILKTRIISSLWDLNQGFLSKLAPVALCAVHHFDTYALV